MLKFFLISVMLIFLISRLAIAQANNYSVGAGALGSITTGTSNIAIGDGALASNTSGWSNVAVGNTLVQNTTGDNNLAIGDGALNQNTTGGANVAVGSIALGSNTTGRDNIAVGASALYSNTTGSTNVAVGMRSLSANTTAERNTAVGHQSLKLNTTGEKNTALGAYSLEFNTTGDRNTALGNSSLQYNTSGSYNAALGASSLGSNTTGYNNTAIGRASMYANLTGSENTALGGYALIYNQTGSQNTVIGGGAGAYNISGSGNVFIGYKAGRDELGSDMLYISNSETATPLIKGNFATNELQLNGTVAVQNGLTVGGNMTVAGSVTAAEYLDANGNSLIQTNAATGVTTMKTDVLVDQYSSVYVRKESTTGAVHIGANSFVFEDAALAASGGRDIMSSSVGTLQIGKQSSDNTYFVGNVHVPKPTAPDHAATRSYVDASSATAAAMDMRLPAGDKKFRLSIGQATSKGESATALNFVGLKKLESGNIIDFSGSIGRSAYSGSMGRVSAGLSW